ncbi:MAG: tetratricopeptide repeat protein [Bryobacteraceae bacterium]
MRRRASLILLVLGVSAAGSGVVLAQDEPWARDIESLLGSGRVSDARSAFSALDPQRRGSYPGLVMEARLLASEQRYLESLKVLESCLAQRRDDPEVYKLVALSAIQLNKLETAEMALKQGKAVAPDDYLMRFHLGALYYTQSRFLEARPELERAASLRADYVPAQIFLGLVLEELGGEQAAIETYRKAISLNESQGGKSELPDLYLGRLFYRLNRFAEALPLLEKASQANPRSAEAWLWLGKTRNSLGQFDQAASALQRAAETDLRNPEPHYVLSRVYLSQHRSRESAEELARFRQLQSTQETKQDGRRRKQ